MPSSTVELFVNFVAGSQGGGASDVVNGAAQTGDYLGVLCLVLFAVLCGASFFLFYKQGLFAEGFTKSNLGKHQKANNFLGSASSKFAIAITFAVMAAMLICGVFIAKNAFADADQPIVADPEAVTATVNEDGTISFGDCNLTNVADEPYVIETSSVAITDEAKSVSALNDTELTVEGFGGVLFNGKPDGKDFIPENLLPLPGGELTPLNFDMQNLDKEIALSLCGKSVFKISLSLAETASVTKAPTAIPDLIAGDTDQDIAKEGVAENGEMMYAVTDNEIKPTDKTTFNATIAKRKDAGDYYLWYYAKGNAGYEDSSIEGPVVCSIQELKEIKIDGKTYYPLAGENLSDDITFYDQNKNKIKKTGPDGKYQMSDLGTCEPWSGSSYYASYYTGNGSFTALRSFAGAGTWLDLFDIDAENHKGKLKESVLQQLKEWETPQIFEFSDRSSVPMIFGVNATEVCKAYGRLLGAQGSAGFSSCLLNDSNTSYYGIAPESDTWLTFGIDTSAIFPSLLCSTTISS